MERKSPTAYSVVFLVESKKFKLLRLHLCRRFRAANSLGTTLEFAVFYSGPDPKYNRAIAFWFFLSTTMVLAAVWPHFARKTTACLVDGFLPYIFCNFCTVELQKMYGRNQVFEKLIMDLYAL